MVLARTKAAAIEKLDEVAKCRRLPDGRIV
jgi:hypothetical protein